MWLRDFLDPTRKASRQRTLFVCLGLTALTLLVFGQAAGFGFIALDDHLYVNGNAALKAGLSTHGLLWALTANLTHFTATAEYWQPLTLLTRLTDYEVFGFEPGGHHATSVLLHLAAGLALFGALRELTGAFWRSAIVAALFLIHPMHVEPVAWLSARKDVVSGLFYILTIWAYAVHVRCRDWRSRLLLWSAFLATNMSKPMAVSLPFVLLLLDLWPLNRWRLAEAGALARMARATLEKLPLFAISVAVGAAAYHVQSRLGALAEDALLPLAWRIGAACVGGVTYVCKALVPADLALMYPHPGRGLDVASAVVCGAVLLAISVAAFGQWKKRPWLTVGWFWFAVVLAPVSGIVQIGDQAMADRYSYLSFIGLFIAVVWQVAELALPRRAMVLLTGGTIAALALGAFLQTRTWRDSESVFTQAIAVTDDNYVAHFNRGADLWEREPARRKEAHADMLEAGRIRRPFLEYQLQAADAALAGSRWREAIPRLARVVLLRPWDAALRLKLAAVLVRDGAPGKALVQLGEAVRYHPELIAPRLAIAEILLAEREPAQAASVLRSVLKLDAENARALELLATLPPDAL